MAIISYSTKAKVQQSRLVILNETAFLRLMNRGINDEEWKRIGFIQTCIRAQIGIGRKICLQFHAKINSKRVEKEIEYDFRTFGKDKHLLLNNKKKYCQKQILKICFYISKLYHIEILKMKVEFLVDDDGAVWLHHVTDIWTRDKCNFKYDF
jgi:hypothetical protein